MKKILVFIGSCHQPCKAKLDEWGVNYEVVDIKKNNSPYANELILCGKDGK